METSIPTNAYWDSETNRLFVVDLFDTDLLCYSYDDDKVYTITIDDVENPAIFMPINNSVDQYLVSSNDEAFLITWDGKSKNVKKGETIFTVPSGTQVDSASVGPNNELYVGNFGPQLCLEKQRFDFYGLSKDHELEEFGNGFITSVGGAFIDLIYYHMDTCNKSISSFDYDPETGALCKYLCFFSIVCDFIVKLGRSTQQKKERRGEGSEV